MQSLVFQCIVITLLVHKTEAAMKKYTGSDIAALAHVSQSTVSRALSPEHAWKISPAKRREILDLCKKYHYRQSADSDRSALRHSLNVCWFLGRMEHDLTFNTFSFLLRHTCDYLQQNGCFLNLIHVDYTQKEHGTSVRHMLKSNTADVYIAGTGLLHNQTLDLLHAVSNRLIYYTPYCSSVIQQEQYHWISRVDFDYTNALKSAAQTIPHELFKSMIFLDEKSSSGQRKYEMFSEMIRKYHLPAHDVPCQWCDFQRCLWDQCYRFYYQWVREIYPRIKGKKLYWCGNNNLAQALCDFLQQQGLVADRDFFIVTFGTLSKTADGYQVFSDPFSVINCQVEHIVHHLGELILDLVEHAVPQKKLVPVSFVASPALGGGAPRQII